MISKRGTFSSQSLKSISIQEQSDESCDEEEKKENPEELASPGRKISNLSSKRRNFKQISVILENSIENSSGHLTSTSNLLFNLSDINKSNSPIANTESDRIAASRFIVQNFSFKDHQLQHIPASCIKILKLWSLNFNKIYKDMNS